MIKRKEKKILVNAKIIAKKLSILKTLKKFEKIRICNLKILKCKKNRLVIEISITLVVEGDYKECFELLKELNKFLFKEQIKNKFGFMEIKTIPASYEVIENE